MGEIYLYTGNGAGKTTNALGLALRSLGHGRKVFIVQFLKGRKNIGEFKIKEKCKLNENYEIHQFGRDEFVDLKNPTEEDKKLAQEGFDFAKQLMEKKPNLLILDELNLVAAAKMIAEKEIVNFLKKAKQVCDVVLTGRYAPFLLMDAADYVNTILPVKMPGEMKAKKGINY